MTQFLTGIDDQLARSVDQRIESGVFRSRSDAVRVGPAVIVEREPPSTIGERTKAGHIS